MNKKIIIGLAILAVIALAVILLVPRGEQPAVEEKRAEEKTAAEQKPAVPTPPSAQLPSGGTVLVDIKGFSFVGQTTRIGPGTTIIWKNSDPAAHTVTSDTGLFDSKALLKGQSYSLTFSQPGVYTYHCAIHPYMTGEIVVR